MYNPGPIYRFLAKALENGLRSALVTVSAVTGASSRNPGTHMAVAEDGSYEGSFSGGCIEAAVVAEALDTIKANETREVRFGAGSRYIDIRLPCGGSVDLVFTPISDMAFVKTVLDQMRLRRPVAIRLPRQRGVPVRIDPAGEWRLIVTEKMLELHYIPPLRLAIFGHGAAVEALEMAALTYGADVSIFTSDEAVLTRSAERGSDAVKLATPTALIDLPADRWSAGIFLFHDHDWEPHLLKAVLKSPPFFIGAMGSRITHRHRLDRLREMGVEEKDLEQIVAPIGLIPSCRDPETLALSILTQVVANYHKRFIKVPN